MRWLPLFVLASLLAPSQVLAWTDASVRSARARLTIDDHANAHVVLEITLRVDGGWLGGFELDGLDPDLVLDASDPVTLVRNAAPTDAAPGPSSASETFAPRVEVHDGGRIALIFPRRGAPRRGEYLVHVAYDTRLAGRATSTSADGVTIRWTFPAWRYGLDSVEVEIVAPVGTTAIAAEDEVAVVRTDEAGLAQITLTRAHLARTREWPIELLVPLAAVDPALATAPPEAPLPTPLIAQTPAERPWQGTIALGFACLLVALRVSRAGARMHLERSVEHPLVPLTSGSRARAILLLGLVIPWLDRSLPWIFVALAALAVAALSASRSAATVLPPKLGSFRHATPTLYRAARRAAITRALGIDAWLDLTTLPGLGVTSLLGWAVLSQVPTAVVGSGLLALALVVHAFLVDARASRPEPALVTLDRLVRLARRLRVSLDGPRLAFLPVIHLGVGGEAHDARIRVVAALGSDVLRTDIVPISRGALGARYGLLVVVRRDGPADAALSRCGAMRELSRGNERIARYLPLRGARVETAFVALLAALETAPAEANATSGITAAA